MKALRVNVTFSQTYEFDLEGEDGDTEVYWLAWLNEQVVPNGFKLVNEDNFALAIEAEVFVKDVG